MAKKYFDLTMPDSDRTALKQTLTIQEVNAFKSIPNVYFGQSSGNQFPLLGAMTKKYNINPNETYYATGIVYNPALALVVYWDKNGDYVSNEYRGVGDLDEYNRQVLNPPSNAAIAGITSYDGGNYGTLEVVNAKTLVNKSIVWFGSSIPAGNSTEVAVNGITSENNYPKMVQELTGAVVHNESVGGSRVSTGFPSAYNESTDPLGIGSQIQSSFGFYSSLAHTIEEKDWIYDNWASIYTLFTDSGNLSATPPITKVQMEAYSFEAKLIDRYLTENATKGRCDLYVFDHGLNDKDKINDTNGDTLPTAYSTTERMYYKGSMYYLIRKILQDNPFAKIAICSNFQVSATWELADIYTIISDLADALRVPFIDIAKKVMYLPDYMYTAGYYDSSGVWHSSGVSFTIDDVGETFTTNNEGMAQIYNASYADIISTYDAHQVVSDEDLANIFEVGTWVYKVDANDLRCPDNTHPHSNASGESNYQIANIIAGQILKLFAE